MTLRIPKTLVVSSSVYPKRSGSAIVVEKLVDAFSSNEVALFGELGLFDSPIQRDNTKPKFFCCRTRFSLFGRGGRFFSGLRWKLHRRIVRRIRQAATSEKCTHIVGVYPDEVYCSAALRAAQELGIGFSTYFHNTFADNQELAGTFRDKLQDGIFRTAKTIFTMSQGMNDYFLDRYGPVYGNDKMVVLPHSYGEEPELKTNEPERGTKKRIVIFGNFNESNLDATTRLAKAVADLPDFELHIFTDVPRWLLSKRGLPVDSMVVNPGMGNLSFQSLIDKLREYDIVGLTHGFTGGYGPVEYQTIFPTRTIPILLSGRPILVHAPSESFVSTFFQPLAEFSVSCASKNTDEVKKAVQSVSNLPPHNFGVLRQQVCRQFHIDEVTQTLTNTLNR